jgi:hypothetical protein
MPALTAQWEQPATLKAGLAVQDRFRFSLVRGSGMACTELSEAKSPILPIHLAIANSMTLSETRDVNQSDLKVFFRNHLK